MFKPEVCHIQNLKDTSFNSWVFNGRGFGIFVTHRTSRKKKGQGDAETTYFTSVCEWMTERGWEGVIKTLVKATRDGKWWKAIIPYAIKGNVS